MNVEKAMGVCFACPGSTGEQVAKEVVRLRGQRSSLGIEVRRLVNLCPTLVGFHGNVAPILDEIDNEKTQEEKEMTVDEAIYDVENPFHNAQTPQELVLVAEVKRLREIIELKDKNRMEMGDDLIAMYHEYFG